uniref:zinc finger protein 880-like n=1 Tax=Styela clava TaxID=7725 RepID=UPI00193A67B9|nr:zinc finger protein 880-like [Styela clava]
MIFRSQKDHCFDLLSKIFGMLNDPSLCDISISVEETVFWAHRCVLITACPTLFNIIVKELGNSQKKIVQLTLQGLPASGFNALLLYVYTGQPPDVNDVSILEGFVKCCRALGVSLPSKQKNKDYQENLDKLQKDAEITLEDTNVSHDKHNEFQVSVKLENVDNDQDVSSLDEIITHVVADLSSAGDYDRELHNKILTPVKDKTEVKRKQKKPTKKVANLHSLFSVKRRSGNAGITSDSTSLLSKYPKMQNYEEPEVKHDLILPVEPPFACPFKGCEKVFETRIKMKKHYFIHGEKKHACDVCGRKFLYKKDLIVHCRIHTGEKPYVCSECGATFTQIGTLKSHLPTHMTHAPKFACDSCDKTYTSSRSLSLHIREKHTDIKPLHICHDCNKSYENRNAYIAHMKTECISSNFRCAECGRRYRKKEAYELHIENCSVFLKHKCHLCDGVFKNKRHLSNHIFSFHSTPKYKTETDYVSAASVQVCVDSNETEIIGKD